MNNNILESLRQDYYVSEKIELNQKGLFANRNYKMGEVISDFSSSEILDHPTYLTVQLNEVDHILLHPIDLQYINHSCSPGACLPYTNEAGIGGVVSGVILHFA